MTDQKQKSGGSKIKIPTDEMSIIQAELNNILAPAFIEIEDLLQTEDLMHARQIAVSIKLDLERMAAFIKTLKTDTSNRKLLLADDTDDFRNALKAELERLGYLVTAVENGKEALAVLEQDHSYSVLVTDCQMPEVSGIKLVKAIAENGYRFKKVVMLTSFPETDQEIVDLRQQIDGKISFTHICKADNFLNPLRELLKNKK